MKIYFDSRTGNVERFASSLPFTSERITEQTTATEPFVLITYTTNFGEVPPTTKSFLKNNNTLLQGVAVSGNRNWGQLFGKSGDTISSTYNVPLLHKFEFFGSEKDKKLIKTKIKELDTVEAH